MIINSTDLYSGVFSRGSRQSIKISLAVKLRLFLSLKDSTDKELDIGCTI